MLGAFNLGEAARCVIRVGSRTLVGCFGLNSDSRILVDKLRGLLQDHFENDDYSDLEPENIAHVISDILYENNLLLSPIVIGLDRNSKPYICAMDELGIPNIQFSLNYYLTRQFSRCTDFDGSVCRNGNGGPCFVRPLRS